MPSAPPPTSPSGSAVDRAPSFAIPWERLALLLLLVVVRGFWLEGLRGVVGVGPVAQLVPLMALGALVWLALWSVPRGLFLAHQGRKSEVRAHLGHAFVWLAFAGATALVETLVERDLHQRMNSVVSAVQRFREENGRFPVHVDEVTPGYLREIPRPWAFTDGCGFEYRRSGEGVSLARAALDDEGQRRCSAQHGLRYRFLLRKWETW